MMTNRPDHHHGLMDAMADQLATQMLKVSGGPAAYKDADVLALALKKIDPELPRRVAESSWAHF